jgi:hypothetical protein
MNFFENLPSIYQRIDDLLESVDFVYLTICMDVFNASIAPGFQLQHIMVSLQMQPLCIFTGIF